MASEVLVIGGGLAGSEAAWQAAEMGLHVTLAEMRPLTPTGAHQTDRLAELVCSNSLGSSLPDRPSGVLLGELRRLDSLLVRCAQQVSVPAGGALAVDRAAFSALVTEAIERHPRIRLERREVLEIPPGWVVCATGPLTSLALADSLARLTGEAYLYFFDAIAPIVEASSLDMQVVYRASRFARGETLAGDYLNCPLDEGEYDAFVTALRTAERIPLRQFEQDLRHGVRAGAGTYFEGCLPLEVMAERGPKSLAFGPLRPIGLRDPRTGLRPHAVVQLRQEDREATSYNLVGFQTNLTYAEQQRVFRLIPGLGSAQFFRYGQMHRNTFVNAPAVLLPTLQLRRRPDLLLAGQLSGVEGYLGNIATGLLAGRNVARLAAGEPAWILPQETMIGALCHYVTSASPDTFQPMKANLGILSGLGEQAPKARRERASLLARRAADCMERYLGEHSPSSYAHSHD
ncbi:MAG: methylenetetrahydrofolate--tRNA-(uracil(54)-C(5))-methyltransferase (FADH(2)-oxidizing) TrmFO [Anaerolineales bacterium]|nr:methylenetetrahydrofolate--tRNA-(uracil(54)-C(5))-methyltransferase (FADH(2)-oxidizing) TrmFO [Anaerolineales bacterium]